MESTKKEKLVIYRPYKVFAGLCALLIIYAFLTDSPQNIFNGLKEIIFAEDVLIIDYLELVGFSAAITNVSLVGLSASLVVFLLKIKPNGSTIMAICMSMGFAFFGKNIYNIWPPMLGVFLFSRFQKQDFKNYSLVCLLSTSLAPIVTQSLHFGIDSPFWGAAFGVIMGIFAGFLLPAIATYTVRVHSGYSLYNVGFASGIVCTFYLSVAKLFGIEVKSQLIWNTSYKLQATIFISLICIFFIILGLVEKKSQAFTDLKKMFRHSGRLVSDFYILYGSSVYINMGLLGLISLATLHLMGMDVNGPTMGAIFTVMGFGAFGKHPKNSIPVILGAAIAIILGVSETTSPGNSLAILFCTTLAPIAGQFGRLWGVLAGFLHVCLVSNVGFLHGGLNLYNNGFAGGFVVLVILPVITALRRNDEDEA